MKEKEKEKKKKEKRKRGEIGRERLLPGPRPRRTRWDGRAVAIRARRDPPSEPQRVAPTTATPPPSTHRLGQGREGGGSGARRRRSAAGPSRGPPSAGGRAGEVTPSSGDGGRTRTRLPGKRSPTHHRTRARAQVRAGAGGRRVPARPAETNPCVEG